MAKRLLVCTASLRNNHWLTSLDIAGQYEGKTNLKARGAVRKKILSLAPTQRTLVLYHDDCLGHATPDYHQEAPGRLTAIMGKLLSIKRRHVYISIKLQNMESSHHSLIPGEGF